ncbi:MAG: hypothetical protein C7B47_16435 [Sulfobacillus thermosulfidooxidans]|uniref:DUF541 domain-containing protein n=1 Tax=Sulfobacillus thermosulfidooxidans TaxID=28034 RepID=A0A2T2WK98_SULTH|nr:MAG: hypothetical protein C7B47_16435 [Sulfobacillus thermosulfidooxidans]
MPSPPRGPPNFSINVNGAEYQATETLQVTFPTLGRLADALQASGIANDVDVQDMFVSPVNSTYLAPTAAALTGGYQAAFANAQATAQMMAQADHLQLGQVVSVTEGNAASANGTCSAMNGCNPTPVGNPPQVGPNQELVTVTVTYDTGT